MIPKIAMKKAIDNKIFVTKKWDDMVWCLASVFENHWEFQFVNRDQQWIENKYKSEIIEI